MNKLARQVRFSINPFLPEDEAGDNSFASKPAGEGLAIFFELCVGLTGQVDADSGFIINVIEIDERVRKVVVPLFAEKIRTYFRNAKHIGFAEIIGLLKQTRENLAGKFGKAMLSDISLKLNPYRKVAIDCEDIKMVYFSEKFEFAAMHKLWNENFDHKWNFDVFGKCANPTGHGHNYIVEVTVKIPAGHEEFKIGKFEKTVEDNLIRLIDHKNINADVDYFRKAIPTVENLAIFSWGRLADKFDDLKLHCVTIWETDKTFSSYYG